MLTRNPAMFVYSFDNKRLRGSNVDYSAIEVYHIIFLSYSILLKNLFLNSIRLTADLMLVMSTSGIDRLSGTLEEDVEVIQTDPEDNKQSTSCLQTSI